MNTLYIKQSVSNFLKAECIVSVPLVYNQNVTPCTCANLNKYVKKNHIKNYNKN